MAELPTPVKVTRQHYQPVSDGTVELEELQSYQGHVLPTRLSSADHVAVDKSYNIRTACVIALGFSYGAALASIAASLYLYSANLDTEELYASRTWSAYSSMSQGTRTVIDLVLSVFITLCTEAMGYIHGTSLRWALLREHRLQYSSNLRLFASARRSWPNSWAANGLSAITLVLSYVGASQTLVPYSKGYNDDGSQNRVGVLVNGPALLFLGLGLLLQALLSTACLAKDFTRVPTWSSNVLTITAACLREQPGHFQHEAGRCLLSAYDTALGYGADPVRPRIRQPSIRSTDAATRHVTRFLWFLTVTAFVWAITVTVVAAVLPKPAANVNGFFPALGIYVASDTIAPGLFVALVIVAIFQTFATIGLHLVELLVNRSRDEQCWRSADVDRQGRSNSYQAGSKKTWNSISAAFTSWQSVSLYLLKPVIHWLFGSSLSSSTVYENSALYMDNRYIFGLAVALVVLLAFATTLSRHQPKGAIPSCWGHIQTLANLIDDWGAGTAGNLHWGDKGINGDGTRHAGTTCSIPLGKILDNALYK